MPHKTVYACFCTDVLHEGHMNIINKARELGDVTVGVLTDEAMVQMDRFPVLGLEDRMAMMAEVDGVSRVVVQDSIFYDRNIASMAITGSKAPFVLFATMLKKRWQPIAVRSSTLPTLIAKKLSMLIGACGSSYPCRNIGAICCASSSSCAAP